MQQNKLDITKPNGALEFLYQNAVNTQVQGTVAQVMNHAKELSEARLTIDLLIKSKERNNKMSNQYEVLDDNGVITSFSSKCDAYTFCETYANPVGTMIVFDTVNDLAWNGPRPTNPPTK